MTPTTGPVLLPSATTSPTSRRSFCLNVQATPSLWKKVRAPRLSRRTARCRRFWESIPTTTPLNSPRRRQVGPPRVARHSVLCRSASFARCCESCPQNQTLRFPVKKTLRRRQAHLNRHRIESAGVSSDVFANDPYGPTDFRFVRPVIHDDHPQRVPVVQDGRRQHQSAAGPR